jgi:hypothetical protein
MAWQASQGLVADGIFGPSSRAGYNATAGTGSTTTTTTTGTVGVITTPGVEGTVTASLYASPAAAKLYENESKRAVMGIELEAKTSDIKIERIKLDLDCSTCSPGSDTDFYRKIASRVYVLDGSDVLASADLNSSTVVQDGANYFITIAGFSYVVPKDTKKVLTIAVDAYSTWDSTYDGDSWTVGVPVDGVRGVDGAGVNQYSPSTAFTRDFTSQAELVDSATLAASISANTPKGADVICALGADEDECDELELLRADFRAEKDNVTITDLVVDITWSGSATTTVGYLYDGSTLIGSDSVDTDSHSGFTFADIDWVVPKDSTKTLSVRVDVTDAATSATTLIADIDTADITAENSIGDGITESGSATGETISIRSVGPEFSLVSSSITKGSYGSGDYSTSTVEAKFTIKAKAVGGDIVFGDAGSSTVPFVTNAGGSQASDDPSFAIYRAGSDVTATLAPNASSTSLTVPSGVTNVTNNSFTLQEGNTVDIPVSFIFEGRTAASALVSLGSYAVSISQLNWVSSAGIQESNFMSGETSWRTSTVPLP